MDAQDLADMISSGETLTVEFKRGGIKDEKIVRAVACMANGEGGYVLLGIEDDGEITGYPRSGKAKKTLRPERLQKLIQENTSPPLDTSVEIVELPPGIGHTGKKSKHVVCIEVQPSRLPVGTSTGVYRKRALSDRGEPMCRPFYSTELVAEFAEAEDLDWLSYAARGVRYHDLDEAQFDRFRDLVARSQRTSPLVNLSGPEILQALDMAAPNNPDRIYRSAVLMFGTQQIIRQVIPNYEIGLQVVHDDTVVTHEVHHLPLLEAAEYLYDRLIEMLPTHTLPGAGVREDQVIRQVPERALREVIGNALIHRAYYRSGLTRVLLTDNELRVENPGGFPPGIQIRNVVTDSRSRSSVLTHAMHLTGLVEQAGQGTNVMFTERLAAGLAPPSFDRTDDEIVRVSFSFDAPNEFFLAITEHLDIDGKDLDISEQLLLLELSAAPAGRLSWDDYVRRHRFDAWPIPDSLHRVESWRLVDIVHDDNGGEGAGSGSSAQWLRLGPRLAGLDPARRGAGPMSAEELEGRVVEYLGEHEMISRYETMAIGAIAEQQASEFLQSLRARGVIDQRGERRGTYYVLPH